MLEDGVLSYYKVHGPDKIVMSPGRDKGARVIGEESWRYMRKAGSGNGSGHGYRGNGFSSERQWKPFGKIHLKVSSFSLDLYMNLCIFCACHCHYYRYVDLTVVVGFP